MTRILTITTALVLTLGGVRAAAAQSEIDALVIWDVQSSNVLANGCRALGYTLKEARSSEAVFIDYLNAQSWDFIGIELPRDFITQKETVVKLLEDHVAAGGALIVNYNHLNEWPRLQKLLGVAATSPVPPMQDILATAPPHCTWAGSKQMNYNFSVQPPDAGDQLSPVSGVVTLGKFPSGDGAILMSSDEKTIVNGFDWHSYGGHSFFAKQQIMYLMECRADFDQTTGWRVLDIFDFLEFQDAFVNQWSCADMVHDGKFDIFDFLAFQDAFVRGCN